MRKRQWLRGVLWLAMGMILWCGSVSALATRASLWDSRRVSYRQPGASTGREAVHDLRGQMDEAGAGQVAAWAQSQSQSVSVTETKGSASADVCWVDGDMSLVWRPKMLAGHMPGLGDAQGCAIDAPTALTLFGSLDIVGRSIWVGGKELEVRGVFQPVSGLTSLGADPGRALAFCPAAAGPDDLAFTALEFAFRDEGGTGGVEQAKEWMRAASMQTSGDFSDYADQRALLRLVTILPAYLLAAFALAELLGGGRALSREGVEAWRLLGEDRLAPAGRKALLLAGWGAGLLLLAAAGAGVALLLPEFGSIPPSYLPTQWSDFAFWPDMVEGNLEAAAQRAMTGSLRLDMLWGSFAGWCVWLAFGAMALLWRGRSALARGASDMAVAPACLAGVVLCAAVPLALWLAGRIGWAPAAPKELLWLPVLFFVLMAALRPGKAPERWLPLFRGGERRERHKRAVGKGAACMGTTTMIAK